MTCDGVAIEVDCNGDVNGGAVLDECNVCGGQGIPADQCDCQGNVFDECNVCGGEGIPADQCDCEGNVLDECNVCGGQGIPDGQCDCEGNIDEGCGCGKSCSETTTETKSTSQPR